MPDNYRFGGGPAETALNPFVLVAMVIAIGLVLTLPRRRMLAPLLFIAFLAPPGQAIVIAGIQLYVIRIVLFFALCRMIAGGVRTNDIFSGGLNPVDSAFLLWASCHAAANLLLYRHGAAFVSQGAFLYDYIGTYCLLRFLICSEEDVRRTMKLLAVVAAIAGGFMVVEQVTRTNVFGLIGGPSIAPSMRLDRVRCQGPFAHPILAGVFGATAVPMFVWLWTRGRERATALLGLAGATAITFTSGSSTPWMAFPAGLAALSLWPLRRRMRLLRWGAALTIVALAAAMKAPVWYLIARVDAVGGSSGFHRAELIDNFFAKFGEWWLLGSSNNQDWGWWMWDIQNQFVAAGVTGGLAGFVFFIMIVCRSFGRLGRARKLAEGDRRKEWLLWALGAVMFAHCVAFFGSNYYDQTKMLWFATLAMISASTYAVMAKQGAPAALRGPCSLMTVPQSAQGPCKQVT